jgi:gluconate 2-dehydrogenase gamma chain
VRLQATGYSQSENVSARVTNYESTNMNRREALQQVAWLMGGAISAPAILGVLNGCSAKPSAGWKPVFLSEEQGALVAEIAEMIIPRTDTPGASDVGVPAFIDAMLKDAYPSEDQERFIAGLKALAARAEREHGRAFLELEPSQRMALVQSVHDAATAEELKLSLPPAQIRRPFILMTKELALLGFFTSHVGATQVLQYDPIPGAFHACVPVSEAGNGRTWALETTTRF